jgi:hypothetical protein
VGEPQRFTGLHAANTEITETHVKAAREIARAWDHVAKQLEQLRRGPDGAPVEDSLTKRKPRR